jgi:molybdopterin converting factor small subunit
MHATKLDRGSGSMHCTVKVASPLRSYTSGASSVIAHGATLHAILADLHARYPGIRFRMIDEQDRIRRHIRLFINTDEATRLDVPVRDGDTVHLICALSGG